MSARIEGAFEACMQFAVEQARTWGPRWLAQLNAALYQQEAAARSFHEKQGVGHARAALVAYREQVAGRFVGEIGLLARDAQLTEVASTSKPKAKLLALEELSLEDPGQVQAKVDLARVQQVVKMAAEDAASHLNAFLSRARGHDVLRNDVNPLSPEAIVAALSRALATLHLEDRVRSYWLHSGALSLGAELKGSYEEMAHMLAQRGVEPAGYLVVQRSENVSKAPPAIAAAATGRTAPDSVPLSSTVTDHGPKLTLDHLQVLLASNLSGVESDVGSGEGKGLAYPLAAEMVTLMLRRIADDHRLLPSVRNLVQGLQPALLALARSEPHFFVDPANPARLLLDAITLQASAFSSEQDGDFAGFFERAQRALVAVRSGEPNLPDLLKAALRRMLSIGGDFSERSRDPYGDRSAALAVLKRDEAACGTQALDPSEEEEAPAFLDTVPMERAAVSPSGAGHA